MPLGRYYKGKGERVMSEMVKRYGSKRGKEVFYATINKRKKMAKRRAEALKRMHGRSR